MSAQEFFLSAHAGTRSPALPRSSTCVSRARSFTGDTGLCSSGAPMACAALKTTALTSAVSMIAGTKSWMALRTRASVSTPFSPPLTGNPDDQLGRPVVRGQLHDRIVATGAASGSHHPTLRASTKTPSRRDDLCASTTRQDAARLDPERRRERLRARSLLAPCGVLTRTSSRDQGRAQLDPGTETDS